MKSTYVLQQDDLDQLLNLLAPDREAAGVKYEQIRAGLIRYFDFKGCDDPASLADETINRVASRIADFDPSMNVQPSTYFRGFAAKILMEHKRRRRPAQPLDPERFVANPPDAGSDAEDQSRCLGHCLMKIDAGERDLIVKYYSRERQEKIELRRRLAEEMNCSPEVLYTRVFRLRAALKQCIRACLDRRA
jgi:DNA-directed RNA polymerase specialized sigma24 family protein